MDDSNQNTTPPVATPAPAPTPTTPPPAGRSRSNFSGIFLIILGVLFLFEEIFPFWRFERLWPIILIVVGAWLIYRHQGK